MKGSVGTAMSSWNVATPRGKRKQNIRRRREHARYKRMCGPVTTRFDPSIIKEQ